MNLNPFTINEAIINSRSKNKIKMMEWNMDSFKYRKE